MRFKTFTSMVALTAIAVGAQSKLDFGAAEMAENYRLATLQDKSAMAAAAADVEAAAIIVLNDGRCVADLEAAGARVINVRGNVANAVVKPSLLEPIAALDGVKSISVGGMQKPMLYFAREITNTNPVQKGEGDLEQSYTGEGVVTGLMDTGIDPNHINFMNSDLTESRVKAVYTFLNNNGSWNSYLTPEAIRSFKTDLENQSHGTHVAGIMAGSYNGPSNFGFKGVVYTGSPMPYYGVAINSDVVMCGGHLYDANITVGVDKVIEYAKSVNKPAVVNLSIGNTIGPHDGSSPFCKYIAECGKDAIICIAAGNEGTDECAVTANFTGLQKTLRTAINQTTNDAVNSFQFWNSTDEAFKFEVVLYNVATKEEVAAYELTETGSVISLDGSTPNFGTQFSKAFANGTILRMRANVDPNNNRYNVTANYLFKRDSSSNTYIIPGIRITGKSGQRANGYITGGSFASQGIAGWKEGSNNGSISDMACADNVIVVGSFASVKRFSVSTGTQYSYQNSVDAGAVSPYSSFGTTFDGRELPDLCGPGSAICSSMSSYYMKNPGPDDYTGSAYVNSRINYWAVEQGTSMATPFVAGTVGLMLEADPTLNVDEARLLLTSTCTAPPSGLTANEKIQWGAGRLNVLEAIKATLKYHAGVGSVFDDDKGVIITSPATGVYNIFAAGESSVKATVYALNGAAVASASAAGQELTLDASSLQPGIYLLSVDGVSTKVTKKVAIR